MKKILRNKSFITIVSTILFLIAIIIFWYLLITMFIK